MDKYLYQGLYRRIKKIEGLTRKSWPTLRNPDDPLPATFSPGTSLKVHSAEGDWYYVSKHQKKGWVKVTEVNETPPQQARTKTKTTLYSYPPTKRSQKPWTPTTMGPMTRELPAESRLKVHFKKEIDGEAWCFISTSNPRSLEHGYVKVKDVVVENLQRFSIE